MKTKSFLMFVLIALIPQLLKAQIVTTTPSSPNEDQAVELIFDLSQSALAGYTSDDVYVHAGLITDKSSSDSDWQYAPNWLDNSEKYKLTSLGNDKWKYTISPDIRTFFGVATDEIVLKLAFVVRNSDGSKEGKDNGADILVVVSEAPIKIATTTPQSPSVNAPAKVLFNLAKSNLAGYSGDIYVHTGVITNKSTSDIDWKYTSDWLENTDQYKLTPEGNDKFTFTLSPNIRSFYGVPSDEMIKKLAFVVRNTDGTIEVKDNGADIFITVYDATTQTTIVSTNPTFPTQDNLLDVTFDLTGTILADYNVDDLYVHTGVITDKSNSDSDWKYATTWLENGDQFKLVKQENNKWILSLSPNIRSYYAVPVDENILKVAFIVRTADGSKEVKDNGKDIFIPVYEAGLQVKFENPSNNKILQKGESLNIKASTSEPATIKLYTDDKEIASVSNTNLIEFTQRYETEGSSWLIVEATNGTKTVRDSISILVKKDIQEVAMPQNVRAGINYIDDTTVTFVLYAPEKRSIYLIGDFNDWTIDNAYLMNRDGDNWWFTLTNVEKGKEYAFQYLIDESLRIADPYTNKVLDPWNDPYIPQSVYPNLKSYPTGKTEGITSVFQTAQAPYKWEVTDFKPESKEKLVIYELHIRDFTPEHSFESTLEKLDYLQTLGINAIELLPVNEFEGNSSWGYNPSFYFAVDKYYGTADAFRKFVDECHKRGIAVIIDMVLNHSFGQSPFAQMYWDSFNNKVSVNNPWYNVDSPNTSYSWGSDFNHESAQTQMLVDSINSFWMSEYKVDGFRFDFTKGFTNTIGDGWAYDQSRINILQRMTNEIHKRKPDAFVILEHLTDNSEETVLANSGMMLWGNMNPTYGEAIMGYTEDNKTDLSWGLYTNRGWSSPSLVAYMESHDEERLMYKAETWGKITSVEGALKRAELTAAFYLTQPGPKMIWQFGELGYDYSINTCNDGITITEDCRVAEKPIRWDYLDDTDRKALYDAYSKIVDAKTTYDVFGSTDLSYNLSGSQKYMIWRGTEYNAFIVGNFDINDAEINIMLPTSGEWVDLITGETVNMPSTNYKTTLKGGEYKLFIDKGATTSIKSEHIVSDLNIPVRITSDYIDYLGDNVSYMTIYGVSGSIIKNKTKTDALDISRLNQGVYIVKVDTPQGTLTQKFVKQ